MSTIPFSSDSYARDALVTSLSWLYKTTSSRNNPFRDNYMRIHMPYCFQLDCTKSMALPVNRKYKPLGLDTGHFYDYDQYAQHMGLRVCDYELLEEAAESLVTSYSDTQFWLYDDACSPWSGARHWAAYEERLRRMLDTLDGDRDYG